jgi:hypothetical protein
LAKARELFESSLAKHKFLTEAIADKVENLNQKKQINDASDNLHSLNRQLSVAITQLRANLGMFFSYVVVDPLSGDKAAQQKVDQLLAAVHAAILGVSAACNSSVQGRMIENVRGVDRMLDALHAAILGGNEKEAMQLLLGIKAPLDLQVQMARDFAMKCTDPIRRQKILDACDAIPEWYSKLEQAVKDALVSTCLFLE